MRLYASILVFLGQLAGGYAVQFARVLNWAIAAALIYRWEGETAFAAFSLARAVILIFNYASIGIAPALVTVYPKVILPSSDSETAVEAIPRPSTVLNYMHQAAKPEAPAHVRLFRTAFLLSFLPLWLFSITTAFMAIFGNRPDSIFWNCFNLFAAAFGLGTCIRLVGDTAGARLQVERRIGQDNQLQLVAEVCWLPLAFLFTYAGVSWLDHSTAIGEFGEGLRTSFVASILLATFLRWWFAWHDDRQYRNGGWDNHYAKLLLATGSGMLIGQLAEFLYAPMNQIIVKQELGVEALAIYAPVLHVDGALLLLVSGLSMVLFPRAATAFHQRKWRDLRRYYIFGTSAALILLSAGAVTVCLMDDWLFRAWFGDPLSATQAILPLVMIHTVVGGSASIGRSILFGMGKVKAYAVSAIVGGVANVTLAILLVTMTDLGLHGIIYATILTVTARCLIWLPIYTMKTIRAAARQ